MRRAIYRCEALQFSFQRNLNRSNPINISQDMSKKSEKWSSWTFANYDVSSILTRIHLNKLCHDSHGC